MCLKITIDSIHAIAKQDITVYKFGEATKEGFVPIMYNKIVYGLNVPSKKVKFTMINNAIEQGYHSYDLATITRVLKHTYLKQGKIKVQRFNGTIDTIELAIGRFTIPKGAEYYQSSVNKFKDRWTMLVSDQIIYKAEL